MPTKRSDKENVITPTKKRVLVRTPPKPSYQLSRSSQSSQSTRNINIGDSTYWWSSFGKKMLSPLQRSSNLKNTNPSAPVLPISLEEVLKMTPAKIEALRLKGLATQRRAAIDKVVDSTEYSRLQANTLLYEFEKFSTEVTSETATRFDVLEGTFLMDSTQFRECMKSLFSETISRLLVQRMYVLFTEDPCCYLSYVSFALGMWKFSRGSHTDDDSVGLLFQFLDLAGDGLVTKNTFLRSYRASQDLIPRAVNFNDMIPTLIGIFDEIAKGEKTFSSERLRTAVANNPFLTMPVEEMRDAFTTSLDKLSIYWRERHENDEVLRAEADNEDPISNSGTNSSCSELSSGSSPKIRIRRTMSLSAGPNISSLPVSKKALKSSPISNSSGNSIDKAICRNGKNNLELLPGINNLGNLRINSTRQRQMPRSEDNAELKDERKM